MREPYFIENSKFPVFLSHFAPIDIWAVSFGIWVWCVGELSGISRRHETIHYYQQLELLFIGQWVLYGLFYLIAFAKYGDGAMAYRRIPFEQEAYGNEKDEYYLYNRKAFAWRTYKI